MADPARPMLRSRPFAAASGEAARHAGTTGEPAQVVWPAAAAAAAVSPLEMASSPDGGDRSPRSPSPRCVISLRLAGFGLPSPSATPPARRLRGNPHSDRALSAFAPFTAHRRMSEHPIIAHRDHVVDHCLVPVPHAQIVGHQHARSRHGRDTNEPPGTCAPGSSRRRGPRTDQIVSRSPPSRATPRACSNNVHVFVRHRLLPEPHGVEGVGGCA